MMVVVTVSPFLPSRTWCPDLATGLLRNTLLRLTDPPSSTRYMATSGLDHQLKIFDLRGAYRPLSARTLPQGAGHLAFSQWGLLAAGMGDVVNIWAGQGRGGPPSLEKPYLTHRLSGHVHGLQFCPFEDVLGVGHTGGVTSMLVPGEWARGWGLKRMDAGWMFEWA